MSEIITPKVRLLFAWYDFWIGAFYDRARRRLYVLPLPCIGFVVQLASESGEADHFASAGNMVSRHDNPDTSEAKG